MKVIPQKIPGVLVFEPDVFPDERGEFLEIWNDEKYQPYAPGFTVRQDNLSYSKKGVLRGLHYQWPLLQAKLVSVLSGVALDVAVDIRRGSPTFGQSVTVELSEKNHRQIFIPAGVAHGFCVTGDHALVNYKVNTLYLPGGQRSIIWNDPAFGIDWGMSTTPLLAPKDAGAPLLGDIPEEELPLFQTGG